MLDGCEQGWTAAMYAYLRWNRACGEFLEQKLQENYGGVTTKEGFEKNYAKAKSDNRSPKSWTTCWVG